MQVYFLLSSGEFRMFVRLSRISWLDSIDHEIHRDQISLAKKEEKKKNTRTKVG